MSRAYRPAKLATVAVHAALLLLASCAAGQRVARFTVFLTGNTKAYLENCGCSAGQAGGVHRRARIINNEMSEVSRQIPGDHGLPNAVFLIDAGNFSEAGDPVRRLLSKGVVRAMAVQRYSASGIGLNELSFPQTELVDLLDEAKQAFPFTAANLDCAPPETGPDHSEDLRSRISRYVVLPAEGGFRLGLIHVIDDTAVLQGRKLASGYSVSPPLPAIRAVLDAHAKEADAWLLTVSDFERNGLRAESVAEFTQLLIVANLNSRNPLEAADSTQARLPVFIERLSDKGKDLLMISATILREGGYRIIGTKFGVKETYKPAPEVQAVIDELKPELESLQADLATDALNKQKSALSRPVYLGYQACYGCHQPIVDQMASTRHMHAYETLQRIGKEHQECAKCHNVGFNQPGGWDVITDRQMGASFFDKRNVQCENCHGPGDYHVLLVQGEELPKDFRAGGRDEFGLLPAGEQSCLQCHFGENDPHFSFAEKWKKIAHGMDGPLSITDPGEDKLPPEDLPSFEPGRGFRRSHGSDM